LWDNAWVICGGIAESTSKILVGPGIVNPYSSTSAEIAMAAMTLDNLSGGRCVLGIGPGARLMLEDGGIQQRQVIETLGRSIEYLKGALQPESETLRIAITRRIPIYVGCQSPRLLEFVGRWQVGALPLLTPPSYATKAMEFMRNGSRESGEGVPKEELVASFLVSVSKDERASLKSFAAFIMPTLRHLSEHQLKDAGVSLGELPDLNKTYSERGWEGLPEKIFKLGITDVESCIESIEQAKAAGYGTVKCGSPLGPDKELALRILAEEVFPHIPN
jgi:5,10-methylenetetrahydromethanopterin reductase